MEEQNRRIHKANDLTPDANSCFDNHSPCEMCSRKDQQTEPDAIKIKLGLVIPSNEYRRQNIEMMRQNLISRRSITFCAEQFHNDKISYDIVDFCVITDGAASLFNEVITEAFQLEERAMALNSVYVMLDIGAGHAKLAAMQGIDIIPSSEKVCYMGINDCLHEIACQVEQAFDLEEDCLDYSYIDNVIRYPAAFCSECGNVFKTPGPCACGGEARLKKNILKLGGRAVDITSIVEAVYDRNTDALAAFCKRYLDSLFQTRGINRAQLDTVIITGGGAEIFGQRLKEALQKHAGDFVRIIKAGRTTWTALNGLGKYTLFKDCNMPKAFDKYIFIDPGNTNTKAKCIAADGRELVKPVLMQTKIATPLGQPEFTLKKANPMLDLEVKIESRDEEEHRGDGHFFVSYLANKGKDLQRRDFITPKCMDDMTYTMINAAIGVVLARDKARNKE